MISRKQSNRILTVLLSLVFFSYCRAQSLTGTIHNTGKDSVTYFSYVSNYLIRKDSAPVNNKGYFFKVFSFSGPKMVRQQYGTLTKEIYVFPGANLKVSFDAANDSLFAHTFSVTGDYGINCYLDSFGAEVQGNFLWSRFNSNSPIDSVAPLLIRFRRFADSSRNANFKNNYPGRNKKVLHDFFITDSINWYAYSLLAAMDMYHLCHSGNKHAFFRNQVEKRLPFSFSPLYQHSLFYDRLWRHYFRIASETAAERGDTITGTDNSKGALALQFLKTRKVGSALKEVIAKQVLSELLGWYTEGSASEAQHTDSLIEKLLMLVSDISFQNIFGEQYAAKKQMVRKRLLGTKAPDFSLQDTLGNTVSLNDFKGKVVLIDIWASTCRPCIQEMPFMRTVADRLKDKQNFALLSVSVDNNKEAWLIDGVQRVHPPGLTLWQGKEGTFAQNYLSLTIPQLILLDGEGKYIDFNPPRASDGDKLYELLIKNLE